MQTNLKAFFDLVRESVFGGSLSQDQVDGCQRIIEYRNTRWPKMPDAELAYLLATTEWETGHSMQPVEEGYPLTGEALRKYQRSLRYYPAYGRGYVQITWPANYARLGLNKPEDYHKALEPEHALRGLFEGSIFGWFTGKKLSDYISESRQDYVNARRVINGLDKADRIAKTAKAFLAALHEAATVPVVAKPIPAPLVQPPAPPDPNLPSDSWMDRLGELLNKLSEVSIEPERVVPTENPVTPIPPPPNAPPPNTRDALAVAIRIEERQLLMLEMFKTLMLNVSTLKDTVERLRAHVEGLRAQLAAKEAEVVQAKESLTPEQQSEFDAIQATVTEALSRASEAIAS